MAPPGPVKIDHKKDGRQRRPHRFHVSRPPPPYPAAGTATGTATLLCHFKDGVIVFQDTHAKLVFSTTNIDGMMNKNPNFMLLLLM